MRENYGQNMSIDIEGHHRNGKVPEYMVFENSRPSQSMYTKIINMEFVQ